MKSLGLLLMFVISGCSAQTMQGNAGSREIQAEEILKRINTGKIPQGKNVQRHCF